MFRADLRRRYVQSGAKVVTMFAPEVFRARSERQVGPRCDPLPSEYAARCTHGWSGEAALRHRI